MATIRRVTSAPAFSAQELEDIRKVIYHPNVYRQFAKAKFWDKFTKYWMIFLECMLAVLILFYTAWFHYGLTLAASGSENGKILVDLTAKAFDSIKIIGAMLGVLLPAIIGALRFFKKYTTKEIIADACDDFEESETNSRPATSVSD